MLDQLFTFTCGDKLFTFTCGKEWFWRLNNFFFEPIIIVCILLLGNITLILYILPVLKSHMSYFKHFTYVIVCKLFTFQSSEFNMAATSNNVFWLAENSKFFSETAGQFLLWYCRNVHHMVCTSFEFFMLMEKPIWLPP